MADIEDFVLTTLQTREGFAPYFSDVTYARDVVDPPVMRHRRKSRDLSLTLNTDEYDIVGGIDINQTKLTLAFGLDGLVDVADSFVDAFDPVSESEESEIFFNATRFAIIFQSAQVFTNDRLRIDSDFLERFKQAMPQDKASEVPYERNPVTYPSGKREVGLDPALRYRVCRLASRIALDRITSTPYGRLLRSEPDNGEVSILKAARSKAVRELQSGSVDIADQVQSGQLNVAIAFCMMHSMQVNDTYPLMWSALANPVEEGLVGHVALPHLGSRSPVRPGWISLADLMDN